MKVSVPSLHALIENLIKIAHRFPLAIISVIIGTFSAIQETYLSSDWKDPFWIKLILCANIGLIYGISLTTFSEAKGFKSLKIYGLRIILLAAIIAYFYSWPAHLKIGNYYTFFMISACGHLLVSLAPFYNHGNINSFWHYNKSLFIRFLMAVLYSAASFAGICIAMIALRELFNFNFNGQDFFRVWIFAAGILNTFLFLAGIPDVSNFKALNMLYPKGLKVFVQFVLIPLVNVYVVILIAYELKILVTWNLPKGWVANLIIAFAVFGVLSILLVFPIRHEADNKWINIYSKVFYWILYPLIALLFVAIITRIKDYGYTEERIWVTVTGIWLFFIASYFIFSNKENIKLIPASLIIAIVISLCIGSSLSIYSQQRRLAQLLNTKNFIFKSGKIFNVKKPLSLQDNQEISSIIQYLYQTHGIKTIQPFFYADLYPWKSMNPGSFTDSLLIKIGSKPSYMIPDTKSGIQSVSMEMPDNYQFNIKGYDYLISGPRVMNKNGTAVCTWKFHDSTLIMQSSADNKSITLMINNKKLIVLGIDTLINSLVNQYLTTGRNFIDPETNFLVAENNQIKVKVFIASLSGKVINNLPDYKNLSLSIKYLIALRNNQDINLIHGNIKHPSP